METVVKHDQLWKENDKKDQYQYQPNPGLEGHREGHQHP